MSHAPLWIIVNPESGGGRLKRTWPKIEAGIRNALLGESLQVAFTQDWDHGAALARNALRQGAKTLIAVGGDGTFSEIVQGFFQNGEPISPDARVAFVPAGRGNDFFKMLMDRDPFLPKAKPLIQGLDFLKRAQVRPLDLIQVRLHSQDGGVTSRFCLNLASFGFGGHVVSRLHHGNDFISKTGLSKGSLAYVLHSAATFFEYSSVLVRVSLDGKLLYQGPLMMGAILNGAFNAGGLCWSNAARIDDGDLDVVLVPPKSPRELASLLPAFLGGDLANAPGVISGRGKQVEVVDLDPARHRYKLFEIDGDLPEPPGLTRGVFEVVPAALSLFG
jgi:diacylglycerol kinase family enzyme